MDDKTKINNSMEPLYQAEKLLREFKYTNYDKLSKDALLYLHNAIITTKMIDELIK